MTVQETAVHKRYVGILLRKVLKARSEQTSYVVVCVKE